MSVRLRRFMERSGMLPNHPIFLSEKSGYLWCTLCFIQIHCKVRTLQSLCTLSNTLQIALESVQEARIVQIDFSAGFDRVNHQGFLYKHCSEGIGGFVLSTLTQFLSNQSQHVMVDGFRSKLVTLCQKCRRTLFWPVIAPLKLNASKTRTMIVSWSRTMHPQSSPLTISGTVLKESDDLVILE